MRVVEASVDWMEKYANDPKLRVVLADAPTAMEFHYTGKPIHGGTLWFAETDGMVRYFYEDEVRHEGFGGSVVSILLTDGTMRHLKGPWSSRCGVMNNYFTQSTEVSYKLDEDAPLRCWTAGALTIDFIREHVLPLLPDIDVVPDDEDDEPRYVIVHRDGTSKRNTRPHTCVEDPRPDGRCNCKHTSRD